MKVLSAYLNSVLPPSTVGGSIVTAVHSIIGPACLHGRVIETRRNDRIIKVERRTLIGDTWRFEETLHDSEDSSRD